MDPRKKMTMKCHPEHETIRPFKKVINNTESKSACAAEGVEEMEGDNGDPENICHPCGEGETEAEKGARSEFPPRTNRPKMR